MSLENEMNVRINVIFMIILDSVLDSRRDQRFLSLIPIIPISAVGRAVQRLFHTSQLTGTLSRLKYRVS